MGRICEEDIGPVVNMSIVGRLLEDACVGGWNAATERPSRVTYM